MQVSAPNKNCDQQANGRLCINQPGVLEFALLRKGSKERRKHQEVLTIDGVPLATKLQNKMRLKENKDKSLGWGWL